MTRLLVHVEGETEETFVREVLARHLAHVARIQASARIIGNARQRDRRGGIRAWPSVRDDIVRHLKSDAACYATTMVDFYGLPATGARAWPGRADAATRPFSEKASVVQHGLLEDVATAMGKRFDRSRFIPYVVMHEFEGLLFSNPAAFAAGIGHPEVVTELEAIRGAFATPEEINDSPTTAPSKRVRSIVRGYEKPLLGTLAALEIGLDAMRTECPMFRAWVETLERLPA